ncbi:hypothetical protein MIND_00391800 [Mycena indigotica]|uniref:Uncharacterized protein n=1 Tax=Mycena indigotica TaxID=2126181 RepID=A0A8H6T590_9AGAR|nr:uncharacterized protein MIND_00391800 [Mycena indigotica]KAF7310182.1 hypothetical protein MIND_00391800 [Mycena indigotica]
MPKARWQLPEAERENFEISANGTKMRCRVCREEGKGSVGKWIMEKSVKTHLQTRTHQACARSHQQRIEQDVLEANRVDTAYDAAALDQYQPSTVSAQHSIIETMFSPLDALVMDLDMPNLEDNAADLQRMTRCREADKNARLADETVPSEEDTLKSAYQRLLSAALARGELEQDEDEGESEEALDPMSSEDDSDDQLEIDEDSDLFPFPTKTSLLLDLLDNLPRCRFTNAQLSVIMTFARCLGVPNVPSLKSFRKLQASLQAQCASEPERVQSYQGNIFYVNNIRETIARDLANPLTASKIQCYPEEVDPGMPVSETWQADRWKEFTPSQLTPMFSRGNKRFFINELAQCFDGQYVIPLTLVIRNGVLHTDAFVVAQNMDGQWDLTDNTLITFPVDNLE